MKCPNITHIWALCFVIIFDMYTCLLLEIRTFIITKKHALIFYIVKVKKITLINAIIAYITIYIQDFITD